jgi:hypothetical protein
MILFTENNSMLCVESNIFLAGGALLLGGAVWMHEIAVFELQVATSNEFFAYSTCIHLCQTCLAL